MRIRIGITGLLAVLLLASPLFSQGMHYHKGMERIKGMADLTDEQVEKIKDIKTSLMKEITPIRTKLKTMRAELDELLIVEKPDTRAINKKIDAMSSIRTEIQKKRIANRLKIREFLTEEQRVWFDAMGARGHRMGAGWHGMSRMMGKRMHRMEGRGYGEGFMRERKIIKILKDGEEKIIEEE